VSIKSGGGHPSLTIVRHTLYCFARHQVLGPLRLLYVLRMSRLFKNSYRAHISRMPLTCSFVLVGTGVLGEESFLSMSLRVPCAPCRTGHRLANVETTPLFRCGCLCDSNTERYTSCSTYPPHGSTRLPIQCDICILNLRQYPGTKPLTFPVASTYRPASSSFGTSTCALGGRLLMCNGPDMHTDFGIVPLYPTFLYSSIVVHHRRVCIKRF
jgi:hypothetical protein